MPISNSFEHIIHTVHLPMLRRLVQENNPLTTQIYNYFAGEGKGLNINTLSNILDAYKVLGKVQESTLVDFHMPDETGSLYLKKIEISNFRKFQGEGFVFEVGMSSKKDPGEPKSLFLIGENGVGKSSIYSAMEYVLQNHISEGDIRNRNFKPRVQNNIAITLSDGTVIHSYEEFVKKYNTYELGAVFCSEYDILTVGQERINDDWISFFGRSMGYGDLLDLLEFLREYIGTNDLDSYVITNSNDLENLRTDYIKTEANIGILENSFRLNLFGKTRQNISNTISVIAESVKKVASDIEELLKSESPSTLNLEQSLRSLEKALDDFPLTDKHSKIKSLKDQVVNFSTLLTRKKQRNDASASPSNISIFRNSVTGNSEYQTELQQGLLNEINSFLESFSKKFSEILLNELETEYSNRRELQLKMEPAQKKEKVRKNMLVLKEQLEQYCQKLEDALYEEMMPELNGLIPIIKKIMEKFKIGVEKHELDIYFDAKKHLNIYVTGPDKIQIEPAVFYNNFRYKLFCLLLKLVTGIGYMKKQQVVRPIIMDDVFYASDFYSKGKVKFFFETLLEAINTLLPDKKLQIICFTHDEIVLNAIHESMSWKSAAEFRDKKETSTIFGRIMEAQKVIANASMETKEELKHRGNLYIELYD